MLENIRAYDTIVHHEDNVHGYIIIVMSAIGSFTNILNILVLTSENTISSTNVILVGLAIADCAIGSVYIPYAYDRYLTVTRQRFTSQQPPKQIFPVSRAYVTSFGILDSTSIGLTVLLAVRRYRAIAQLRKSNNNSPCDRKNTFTAVVMVYVLSVIINTPLLFAGNGSGIATQSNTTAFNESQSDSGSTSNKAILVYEIIISSLIGIAVVGLLALNLKLICKLVEAKKRRQRLRVCSSGPNLMEWENTKIMDRTITLLLVRVFFFLTYVIPTIIYYSSNIRCDADFCFDDYDEKFYITLDVFSLCNIIITFPLYLIMSSQFRTAFQSLQMLNICKACLPP